MSAPISIAVIGAGAAGLMAAGTAARLGADVTVYEHKNKPARKLAITGKGRCNVTSAVPQDKFLENILRNPRFLYAALRAFSPEDTVAFFEERGVPLKTERGNRVFPVSDKADDIVRAMQDYSKDATMLCAHVRAVKAETDGTFTVIAADTRHFDRVILATGGRSYPLTGSDGSGLSLARGLGHTVTPLFPSLVPLVSPDPVCADLMGLSLKNVGVRLVRGTKVLFEDFGELLFTHFGVSGPTVLSASAAVAGENLSGTELVIDLKPALDEATLDARLLRDFAERQNRNFANALDALLPSGLREVVAARSGIPPEKKIHEIQRQERHALLSVLKGFRLPISGTRPIEEAIITRGGVQVKEIAPGTMMSRLHPGLFFAGEMIDTDGYTGGFNLQIAWSTGYLAGKSAAEL